MNAKILKFELFTLFLLTLVTLVIFYYKDSLPDNYLSISSTSSYGFFTYYLTTLLNSINYYSGPWILIPCVIFTIFYTFIFSKRADWIDAVNIVSLSLFSFWTLYYLQPALLGVGLFQVSTALFSPFVSFLLWGSSLVVFIWGAYRGSFTEKMKLATAELKRVGFTVPGEKVRNLYLKYSTSKENFLRPQYKAITHVDLSEEKEEESFELKGDDEVFAIASIVYEDNQNMLESQATCMPDVAASESGSIIMIDNSINFISQPDVTPLLTIASPSKNFSEEKYFNLIKMASPQNGEHKVSSPDEKYFHDIIHKIQVKLGEFKIQGRIISVLKGPVVDTFEWELGVGEKVSRLTVTSEDLSLALSGSPIRMVYPMKGRTTVGIEVPRNPREFIFLNDIISSQEYINTIHQLPLAMGKDAFGEPVVVDLAAMPHMLVAGSTGAGKSVFINSILVSLLIKKSPLQMKLILIDPKQLELALYARLPHLLMPVVTEAKTAATALLWACQEMERRYSIMSEFGVRNIEGFNHKLKRAPGETINRIKKYYEYVSDESYELPYLVIIVDEFADLILTQKGKEIETHICRLAAKARAAGIHLILATQRPSVDVITGLIKSNFPTRVSFRVTSSTDSRTILNAMGAEKLLGKGDMLYKQGVDTTRIHSAFVEEDEIESLTEQLAAMAPIFSQHIVDFLENGGEEVLEQSISSREGGEAVERDGRYDEAIKVVVEHRSASASLLQRRLGVGYNRAANLIEEMEAKGVVGPAQGSRPRKVLMGVDNIT